MDTKWNQDENPLGGLVAEHRLIARYLELMKKEMLPMELGKKMDWILIERIIDFFKTYAHRCHYGKEEEIFFRRLYLKRLLPGHKEAVDGLVLEHIRERELMDRLEIAKDKFWLGDRTALGAIKASLKGVLGFYPGHMQKEEKEIFIPGLEYFDKEERGDLLREFAAFDQKLIHEKYIRAADRYEGVLDPAEYGNHTVDRYLQPESAGIRPESPKDRK